MSRRKDDYKEVVCKVCKKVVLLDESETGVCCSCSGLFAHAQGIVKDKGVENP